MLYFKAVNEEAININNLEYEKIKIFEREQFKKLVRKEEVQKYKCIYNYIKGNTTSKANDK